MSVGYFRLLPRVLVSVPPFVPQSSSRLVCPVPFIPLVLTARILSIPSQILKNPWNIVPPNWQHLGQVTVLEQEKPVETQTLPSDVKRQFLQWTQTVVPCCLLAYQPCFQLFASLQFLCIWGECLLKSECQLCVSTEVEVTRCQDRSP
jgi:hypothetical protein